MTASSATLGSDTITGGAGYDILTGGEGADSINGGDDADQIWGNAGEHDRRGARAGDDSDTLYVSHVDFITYTTAESGTITFKLGRHAAVQRRSRASSN